MEHTEVFQAVFDAALTLPARLAASYEPERCLSSHGDRMAWRLRRKADGAAFFLRIGPEEALFEEFQLLNRAAEALPGRSAYPIDCFAQDGTGYLLRAWLPGQTLAQWRAARGGCSDRTCADLGRQICALAAALHSLKPPVIHRDIKPENLIVGPDGRLSLIDFDIARLYRQGESRDTSFLGTEGTAAPEQYGFAQTDARTDVYAMGMTLLWLRTGVYDRAALPQAGPRLRRVLARATDFSPARRYASAADMGRALQPRPVPWPTAAVGLAAAALALCYLLQSRTADSLRAQLDAAQTQLGTVQTQLGEAQTQLNAAQTQLGEAQAQLDAAQAAPSQDGTEAVDFDSRCLEAAVRAALERPAGDVTYDDLQQVQRLAVTGQTVIGAEHTFSYVGCPYLDGQAMADDQPGDIHDLSLLAHMPNLREVILCGQPAADLSPLEGLPIERLILGGCQATDFSALSSLTSLRELVLDPGGGLRLTLEDLRFLEPLPLEQLSLNNLSLPGDQWRSLASLDQVWRLVLFNPPPEALTYLPEMDALFDLEIYAYPQPDLTPLNLPKLDTLTIWDSSLTLEGAEQLTNLGTFALIHCPVQDLSPLNGLARLFSINLDGPELDYTQLNALPNLLYVRVPAAMRDAVEAACPGHTFQLLET